MDIQIKRLDWFFFIACLFLGIVAEEAFFRGEMGVAYILFIALFYAVFFYRFRSFSFSHQRFGYLLLIAIWLLAVGYFLYDVALFKVLNLLIIPSLVIFHLVVITSPKKAEWSRIFFVFYTLQRLFEGFLYNAFFTKYVAKLLMRSNNKKQYDVWKKVIIGICISIPLLFLILQLLVSADAHFEKLVSEIPNLLTIDAETVFRIIIILLYTFGFFGFMQVLINKQMVFKNEITIEPIKMDGIITLTMLLLFNAVYVLFIAVQFTYFFSGTLNDGYTYAEYARRGFFELLFVTLINITITTAVIHFTKTVQGTMKKAIRLALSVLVLSSGVLLVSAFMRMSMYEAAYGYTFTRVLVNTFMVFLMVILAYTFVKIWLEKLSLFRFYFIASLIYYVGINVINLDRIVVERNLERFEMTGKIDIGYLSHLSSTGILGLMELHERNPHIQGLEELLQSHKEERMSLKTDSWRSFNVTKNKAYIKLGELELDK
ncbi:DUF4173 domain-containing protein [Bacillus sp. FJAT-50079]|uniref:DUF4153 domain-containing protein n=1 Tax=Bacillus sp. FJAT-50079 TaxID=2833577 RepID=UPI001BC920A9|nr:DUF4173 domain-containing protein [Bacillus sp. FJAT-50079]MBS4209449.1 DUF4173 domain-containing protein [Bacillus sp. FJAT-50079]